MWSRIPNVPKRANKLTPKQGLFISEYLKCLNGAEAARKVGFGKKNPDTIAAQLLGKPHVQEAIRIAQEARQARTNITVDRVLQELAILSFSNVKDYVWDGEDLDVAEGVDPSAMRAVSSVTTKTSYDKEGNPQTERKFTLWSKTESNKMLGNHLQMFIDKHELSAGPSIVDFIDAVHKLKADKK